MPAHKKPMLVKVCEWCGSEFKCRKPKRRFCSHKCSNRSRDYSYRKKDPVTEFWNRVIKGSSEDDCWDWSGARFDNGYARASCGPEMYAHRLSYITNVGPIPEGLQVLHSCDNPPCTNPRHLFIGTPQDNTDDMWSKGRANPPKPGFRLGIPHSTPEKMRGEMNGNSKLSEADILEIRRRYKRISYKKSNTKELADEFGVCCNCIRDVIKGKRWNHVQK